MEIPLPKPKRKRRSKSGMTCPGDPFYHPQFDGKPKGTHLWYDSVDAYVEHVHEASQKNKCQQSRTNSPSAAWDMHLGYEGTLQMARTGWSEGAEQVDRLLDKVDGEIRKSLPLQRNTLRPAMIGGRVSVPAFLAGHPKTFLTLRKEAATCKTVTMAVNIGCSGSVSASTMVRRGVAIASVIRALEQRRVRVELIAIVASESSSWPGSRAVGAITVKRAEEKLQVDTVAFALAHVGFARRLGFACFETVSCSTGVPVPSGYGRPVAVRLDDCINIDTVHCHTDEEMQAYVTQQLQKIIAS